MNDEVSSAVLRLQGRLLRGRMEPWRVDRTEEALNFLLNKPFRTGDAFHLERNALSDARKKLQRRATLFSNHIAEVAEMVGLDPFEDELNPRKDEGLRAEIVDFVQRTSSAADVKILSIAMEGGTARDVAEVLGIDYDIAKVRLSRARQRARAAWGNA